MGENTPHTPSMCSSSSNKKIRERKYSFEGSVNECADTLLNKDISHKMIQNIIK